MSYRVNDSLSIATLQPGCPSQQIMKPQSNGWSDADYPINRLTHLDKQQPVFSRSETSKNLNLLTCMLGDHGELGSDHKLKLEQLITSSGNPKLAHAIAWAV